MELFGQIEREFENLYIENLEREYVLMYFMASLLHSDVLWMG